MGATDDIPSARIFTINPNNISSFKAALKKLDSMPSGTPKTLLIKSFGLHINGGVDAVRNWSKNTKTKPKNTRVASKSKKTKKNVKT